jgi:hypothetical protein
MEYTNNSVTNRIYDIIHHTNFITAHASPRHDTFLINLVPLESVNQ